MKVTIEIDEASGTAKLSGDHGAAADGAQMAGDDGGAGPDFEGGSGEVTADGGEDAGGPSQSLVEAVEAGSNPSGGGDNDYRTPSGSGGDGADGLDEGEAGDAGPAPDLDGEGGE